MTFIIVIVAMLLVPALIVWTVSKRSGEIRELAERGRPVAGRIVDKRARHSRGTAGRHRRVQIAYERPDTGPQARWISVSRGEWQELAEGAAVALVYLPDRPAVFAMRTLIDQARAARGLPPLV